MFLAACEGYFDKENDYSALLRVHALCVIQASGAKLKGGTDIRLTDLWLLKGEAKHGFDIKTWGTKEDQQELWKQIEQSHGIKLS